MQNAPLLWALGLIAAGAGAVMFLKLGVHLWQRGRATPHRVGEAMNVEHAKVVEWTGGSGKVVAGGELWRATSDEALSPGDAVTVTEMKGLVLKVKRKND